jgi:hypothetical protein
MHGDDLGFFYFDHRRHLGSTWVDLGFALGISILCVLMIPV